jgi:O-methyltransferase
MLKSVVRKMLARRGLAIVRTATDLPSADMAIIERVRAFTATSPERLIGLIDAVNYVVRNKIPGAFVECGVWRGGSMMAVAFALMRREDISRDLFLFDTYEGMPPPTEADIKFDGVPAGDVLGRKRPSENRECDWCVARLEDVQANLYSTGYPHERLHFIKGRVEESIPGKAPATVAVLRLDTDWYESTVHELTHLYPRLATNGVLIIDDYGHWLGARKAVDEYFSGQSFAPLLNRLDYTGRIAIKP